MSHKRLAVSLTVLAIAAFASSSSVAAQQRRAEVALEEAMHVEQVEGDLQRAITLYQRILTEFPSNRVVGAKAQLHIGICYETLGLQEATQAYQRVVANYGDQPEMVSQARARLAALRPALAAGRGPIARRLLSGDDTDMNNLFMMVPSPDGRRVAYVDLYLGALHLRDLASGEEEELVPGLPAAFNLSPEWSPDGTRLAFLEVTFPGAANEAGIESIKILDLASRKVTPVPGTELSDPRTAAVGRAPVAWFPDGQSLLYKSNPNGAGELGIVSVHGGTPRAIADGVTSGSLSPDGRYVAFARELQGGRQIFIQPVARGTARQVADGAGEYAMPLWSPDGAAVAYQRPDGIWIVPIADGDRGGAPRLAYATTDGMLPHVWTEAGGLYFTRTSSVAAPSQLPVDAATGSPAGEAEVLLHHPERFTVFAWSPDLRRIAFVVPGERSENGPRSSELIAVYAADGSSTNMYAVADSAGRISDVWWTGDGREVLFRSRRGDGSTAEQTVRALDPSTGGVRDLFPWSASRYASYVSPDRQHTIFVDRSALPDTARVGWVVTGRDGVGGRLAVPWKDDNGLAGNVRLSPRGDRLLFTRFRGALSALTGQAGPEPGTLWVVAADGTGLRRIAAALMIRSAVWDPRGRFIAYTAAIDMANTVLRIVDVESGVTRDVPLAIERGQEVRVTDWSGDGRLIGIVGQGSRYEYWTIQGLLDAVR